VAQKKVRDQPLSTRQAWIASASNAPAVLRQCRLSGVARATVYAKRRPPAIDLGELVLLRLLDEQFTARPFYGSRKMTVWLRSQGHAVNRKRVQRLMRILGLVAMVPGPNTSKPHPENKKFPYLLRGLCISRPNQVWSADITYVRLAHGFVYLIAIIDWYSRKVLSWRLSNTMDAGFCLDCLNEALAEYGAPEIFNTDQGAQFTSSGWITTLQNHGSQISMDGRGRALDNIFVERLWRSVKYEDIYLKGYASLPELLIGLANYFVFYNAERIHQALDYRTPDDIYRAGEGGGASIPDYFSDKRTAKSGSCKEGESTQEMGQRQSAAVTQTPS
jgi:putative transposase